MNRRHDIRGIIQLEAIAALTILLMVLAAFALLLFTNARGGHVLISRQRAVLAAEAVLNEARAGIRQSDDGWSERFANLKIHTSKTPATGEFVGCELWTVEAITTLHGRTTATVRLRGIVPMTPTNESTGKEGVTDDDV